MLFDDQGSINRSVTLAISQPAHALVSGQILRDWVEPLHEQLILTAEQHDIAWLDWEVSPTFDPASGRPHVFRDIGAVLHAPMWERGVDRACAAWGRRVALLVSLHGSTIYRRFNDRHRSASGHARAEDERAAEHYLSRHRSLQEGWMQALGLDVDVVAREADLLAFADTLSLILCGALPAPPRLIVAGETLALRPTSGSVPGYSLDPWPFASDTIDFEIEARALPHSGRLKDEAAMRTWLADPTRIAARSRLVRAM